MQQKGTAGQPGQHVCYVPQSCKQCECSVGILHKILSKQFHRWDKGSPKHLTRLFLLILDRVNKRDTKGHALKMVCSGNRASLYKSFPVPLVNCGTLEMFTLSHFSFFINKTLLALNPLGCKEN